MGIFFLHKISIQQKFYRGFKNDPDRGHSVFQREAKRRAFYSDKFWLQFYT